MYHNGWYRILKEGKIDMGDDFLCSEDRDEEKQHDLFIVNKLCCFRCIFESRMVNSMQILCFA